MKLDNDQYRIIVESSPNMIWRAGTDTLCNYFNTTWLKFTGRTMTQEMGNGWAEGIHPEDFDMCLKVYLEAFAKQESFEMEYRLKRQDGVYRWINDRGVPYYIGDHEFAGYIGSCMDVTDKVEGQKLRDLAQRDGLTRIYNRQYFEQLANVEFSKAKRFDADLCVVMIDIDHFKTINDTFGHHAGDLVLKTVAKTINESIRAFDLFGRYGGDEFVLLMSNTNYVEASILIARLKHVLETIEIKYNDTLIRISASFGLYQMHHEVILEKVIIEADKKLYEIKNSRSKQPPHSVEQRPAL
ncbi:sensor domain-containing diguanylate cyclase [Acetobacterium wieringae]|uniref:sensor domain-containing diguanylate cyclase n=1 Tax=Acetobacterium wieringae TaxID=52694 RepID=UPI0020349365|nr:sensor domain-containing diguanylate cyclase [Acetobacterium wieringae]URN84162.1 sensor domain-containing diguanylate cyclase [Acetobacterium wieringae]